MTDESVSVDVKSEDPIAELRKMIGEQNAVILKQNEMLKALNERINESEKAAAASPAAKSEPAEPQKSPQEIAWESMMKEMNIKEE